MSLPIDAKQRKGLPVVSGVLDYFPDAIAAIADLSLKGNEQHNPGQPLHWNRSKSTDHADCIGRHLMQRGTIDTDGVRHSAKVAWRALALLQTEIESGAMRDAALRFLAAEAQQLGMYDYRHPMQAESLRDEYEKSDGETGV